MNKGLRFVAFGSIVATNCNVVRSLDLMNKGLRPAINSCPIALVEKMWQTLT
ncbi:MAG: hypothetical protein ACFFCW_26675 [Candidatus Hodarchaeota archaeon]